MTTAEDVKALLVAHLERSLQAGGYEMSAVPNDLDLRAVGILDSLGFLSLLSALERRLGRSIDLSELPPADLTKVGALCRHVAENLR